MKKGGEKRAERMADAKLSTPCRVNTRNAPDQGGGAEWLMKKNSFPPPKLGNQVGE